MKNVDIIAVPQNERVKKLGAEVLLRMNELSDTEALVVGIPQVLGTWEDAAILVLLKDMQRPFWAWLQQNAESIKGPVYNLSPLNASFLCMVVDKNYDPRQESLIIGTSEAQRGVLKAFCKLVDESERKTA